MKEECDSDKRVIIDSSRSFLSFYGLFQIIGDNFFSRVWGEIPGVGGFIPELWEFFLKI